MPCTKGLWSQSKFERVWGTRAEVLYRGRSLDGGGGAYRDLPCDQNCRQTQLKTLTVPQICWRVVITG